jgi:hypothetical protein
MARLNKPNPTLKTRLKLSTLLIETAKDAVVCLL